MKPANMLIIIAITSNLLLTGTARADKRVLVVHSYHLNCEWTHAINKAFVQNL